MRELRLGIVQIEDVNGVDAEISAAAVDLVSEKVRRHAVHAGNHIRLQQSGRDRTGREESGLGTHHDFLAAELS